MGALGLKPSAASRAKAAALGFDFFVGVHRKGDPTASLVLTELRATPASAQGRAAISGASSRRRPAGSRSSRTS